MNKKYNVVPLCEVMTHYQDYIDEPEPITYPKLSVKLYGKGAVLDTSVEGSSLKMKKHQIAKKGQIILSEIWGKKGAIGIVPPEGDGALCTSHFFLFDIRDDKIEQKYLQAIFTANYLEEQLNVEAQGTTGYAAVRPKHLLAATIPLPPIEEQRRIVARIEELAAKIEEARGLRREAVEEVGGLYAASLPDIFGKIPVTGYLKDILITKPQNGWSARCDNLDTGIPVLSLSAITGFYYKASAYKKTSEPTSADAHYWLRPGDLLITRSNTPDLVGHAAIYNGEPNPCIYPDLMMRLEINESIVKKQFVHGWLRSKTVREYIRRMAKGTSESMKKISQETVMNIPFPRDVSLSQQEQIIKQLNLLDIIVQDLKQQQSQTSAELNALLPSILDKAFKGEL